MAARRRYASRAAPLAAACDLRALRACRGGLTGAAPGTSRGQERRARPTVDLPYSLAVAPFYPSVSQSTAKCRLCSDGELPIVACAILHRHEHRPVRRFRCRSWRAASDRSEPTVCVRVLARSRGGRLAGVVDAHPDPEGTPFIAILARDGGAMNVTTWRPRADRGGPACAAAYVHLQWSGGAWRDPPRCVIRGSGAAALPDTRWVLINAVVLNNPSARGACLGRETRRQITWARGTDASRRRRPRQSHWHTLTTTAHRSRRRA